MFAGCIELNTPDLQQQYVSDCLKEQASAESGLAEIPFDDSGVWRGQNQTSTVTLVQQRRWNTAESRKEQGIVEDPITGTKILSWSRIDNRPELISELTNLGMQAEEKRLAATDAGLILVCWKYWQESVCEHLIGDFAFAIYQPESETLFLGRDHLGVKPLYLYQDEQRFVFATSLAVIANCGSLNLKYSEQWLARYILDCAADWKITPYQHINKLAPAHCLTYKNGNRTEQAYFEFSEAADLVLASDQEYVAEYFRLFSRAVSDRVSSDYPVGSELSGGLDSSSITALAAKSMDNSAQKLFSYAIIRSEDEPGCIDAVNRAIDTADTFIVDKAELRHVDFELLEKDFARTIGTAVENSTAIAHYLFYQDAQNKGVRTLLSGFGGDEFTTNYGSLALTELWNERSFSKWLERCRGNWLTSKLRAIKWCLQNMFGLDSSSSKQLLKQALQRWQLSPVSVEIAKAHDLKSILLKRANYDRGYQTINAFVLADRWSPSMTARLENCTLMAARYGIEYRWPLLDIRLLNFFLSVPAEQKLGPRGIGRYLHRRAMVDSLPEQIVWRDKTMGAPISPTSHPLPADGLSVDKELLENPVLKNILQPQAYEQLMDGTPKAVYLRLAIMNNIKRLSEWLAYTDKSAQRISSRSN